MKCFGGIEAGGTKWVVAVGSSPDDLRDIATIPTTTPVETLGHVSSFFADQTEIAALGIGSFGPLDLDERSTRYGTITTTPKPGWSGTNLLALLSERFTVPIAIDTDVNAAALGEGRWGAGQGLGNFCYITVGTGIGGGVVTNGQRAHGLLHPEFGHMRIPHDRERDPFAGLCPYHGDCFEGLAAGEAIHARFGIRPEELRDPEAWALEANYIALGLVNVICTLSPQRIILGGGVMNGPDLLSLVQGRVVELAAGYFESPELTDRIADYIVAPALGERSGVLGALALAQQAAHPRRIPTS